MANQDPDPHVTEERLRRALRSGRIVAWEWDLETGHISWSENTLEVLGWISHEAKDFDERVHQEDRERHQAALKRTLSEGVPCNIEIRFLKPDGTFIWIKDAGEVQITPENRRILSGITRDITDRKQAEAQAQATASLLKATLEHMDQGLLMFDATETIRVYNQRALDLLELPRELLENRPTFKAIREYQLSQGEFVHGSLAFRHWVASRGVEVGRDLYERVRPDGTALEIRTVPLEDGGAVRTYTDITARRQAEAELRQSEERYRALVEAGVSVVWRADPDGRILAAEGRNEFIGQPLGEYIGGGWIERVHPEDRQTVASLWHNLQTSRETGEVEYRVQAPDGEFYWVHAKAVPLTHPDGSVREWVGTLTDITRRRHLEAQLRQAQKMEAVGQLTGGIAHDFNNLLTVIVGNSELLVEMPSDPDLTRSLASMILQAAEKGSDLTQRLLAFGRRQTFKPERLNLDQVIEGMLPLLGRTISANIEIVTELEDGAFAALTDRTLLESAILSLVVNSRDAMPQGGMLTIRTGERIATMKDGLLPAGQPVVFISISDTGCGMSPEVLARVFEPFYTTKAVGKGTGLGLPMVHGFAGAMRDFR